MSVKHDASKSTKSERMKCFAETVRRPVGHLGPGHAGCFEVFFFNVCSITGNSPRVLPSGKPGAVQGDYQRRMVDPATVPEASDFALPTECYNYSHRSVFVEWRDYEGTYGHEEVHY